MVLESKLVPLKRGKYALIFIFPSLPLHKEKKSHEKKGLKTDL